MDKIQVEAKVILKTLTAHTADTAIIVGTVQLERGDCHSK